MARKNIRDPEKFGTMPKGTRIEAFLESIKDSVGEEEATVGDEEEEESSAAVSDDSLDAIQATTSAPITSRDFVDPHAPMPPQQQNELIQQLKKRLKKTVSENATTFLNSNNSSINNKLSSQKLPLSGASSQQSLNLKRPKPKPRFAMSANTTSSIEEQMAKTAHIRQLASSTNWQIKGNLNFYLIYLF